MELTLQELQALSDLLIEEAIRRDDDGNDGAFDRSPLKSIYDKVRAARIQFRKIAA